MKTPFRLRRCAARSLAMLAATGLALAAQASGTYTVNTTGDTHAAAPASSPNDSGGHISLRSAIEAASAQSSPTTINVPAGTYNLTLGELDLYPSGNGTAFITGAGPATTIVNQTDGSNRVFNVDANSIGNTLTTFSGLTIQGGQDGADYYGGAGILAGSTDNTPEDMLTLSNCVVQNNHCKAFYSTEPGGGVQMGGGNLYVTSCTFSNNSSGESLGGAIFTYAQTVAASLNVTNTLFVNNAMTNNSGAGPDGGGAIAVATLTSPTSAHHLVGCIFSNNRAIGNSGETFGGGIYINSGTLNISGCTIVSNTVTGAGGLGGGVYVDSGTVNVSFCRLFGNHASVNGSAIYNHGNNAATTVATNDWWGCDGGPGATGCDVAAGDGSTLTDSPWLVLSSIASPNPINVGQATTLTASVLTNSAGQTLTAAQVGALLGLPLTWSTGMHGGLQSFQTVLQPNGQATAVFTNDNTCNSGAPSVTLDNGTSAALIAVQCADLTLFQTNNVNGTVAAGNSWTWNLHVANAGAAPAPFAGASTVVLDNLPNSGLNYGTPAVANLSGISGGTLVPAIDGSQNLTVTASGAVTLSPGASFDVQFTATPAQVGAFTNPRSNGVCLVDPYNTISESNEGNNGSTNMVVVTCPVVTATVSGNTTFCSPATAFVTVTVSGGVPPYSVTLNNGGGTMSGASPLVFAVTPATTTTYQVSSGSDAESCPVTGSGSATVTISALAAPVITTSPNSLLAHSFGNQASAPTGYSSYSWTINNGTIQSPTNQPSITYAAGNTNNVTLGVTVFNANGCSASNSVSVPVITGFSVHTNVTFTDALAGTTIGMAFDGTNYWSCSGGTSTGMRLARYGLTGAPLGTYSPGLDFRSVFTRPDGALLARAYNDNVIYIQTNGYGVFVPWVTLSGGALYEQSSVVLNGSATEFDAMNSGVVSRWGTNGTYLGAVNLLGFGNVPGENIFPANRGLGAFGNFWLTYNGSNIVSLWDANGNRVTQITLAVTAASFDSGFSFSYCNGKAFIVDVAGGLWRGHDLNGGSAVAVLAAEATVGWNADVVSKISGAGSLARVDLFNAYANPSPTLAQLCAYQAVLVYADYNFYDQAGMGNVLADYLDQGGGVLLQTFAFATNGASYGLGGRVSTNGYLPFTATSYGYPASLAMVKDLPSHPLLDGVNTFAGGTTSFQNSPMSTNAGAIQVAHWSNGEAFAGSKDNGAGRAAGLNFFPPSSDSASFGWDSTTDGARLMANGLLWSGKIPPNIAAAPADQIVLPGATAQFAVVASGTSPLAYQWRLNGTNLPGATGSTLSVPAVAANYGAYSVVVSNLYGTTTSLNALLNPQLRFLSPAPSHGAFSLYLADADGTAVASNRAARVTLYGATNLLSPWTLLTNPVVPSSGQLRADGFSTTNSPSQFFRAVEIP